MNKLCCAVGRGGRTDTTGASQPTVCLAWRNKWSGGPGVGPHVAHEYCWGDAEITQLTWSGDQTVTNVDKLSKNRGEEEFVVESSENGTREAVRVSKA